MNNSDIKPVAWVPVHPKNGPLWAMTTVDPSPEHLPSYPLQPLYASPAKINGTLQRENEMYAAEMSAAKDAGFTDAMDLWTSYLGLQEANAALQRKAEQLARIAAVLSDSTAASCTSDQYSHRVTLHYPDRATADVALDVLTHRDPP